MIALVGTYQWMSGIKRTITDRHFDANALPVRAIMVTRQVDAEERLRGVREHVEVIAMPSEYLTREQLHTIEYIKYWNTMVEQERVAARKRNLDTMRPEQ